MESKTTKGSQVSVFAGAFTPVLAKHTKNLSPVDILAVGIDRMLRNFEPMRRQVEAWRASQLLMRPRSSERRMPRERRNWAAWTSCREGRRILIL